MNFILWIILGGVAGWIASMIMGKDAKMGLLANIVVGILGAFLGGWLLDLLDVAAIDPQAVSWPNFFSAIFGAVVLLFLWRLISNRRAV